ncbi:MAG: PDDEXK nuclease domain-containing protein [Lachnospiraceae bacterium]|nr:PDDEXK nuclease domain-containing protein [Lachnospiraceae bacterium]
MDLTNHDQILFKEISAMIEQSKRVIYSRANSETVLLFWKIGQRVNNEILNNKRADYGKKIVVTLSRQLNEKYGRSFEEKNLRRMLQFSEQFSDEEMVVSLSRQLSWSHFLTLIPLKSIEAKMFYALESMKGVLSVRDLRKLISRKAYERKEIANSQITTASSIPFGTFKDPYLFDILGLKDEYLEIDLEEAILRELEKFILEFGKGFAFMERQKRMIIDGRDNHLDLLFYNRNLKRLVAVELKVGRFEASYKGQMQLYLGWLDKYERQEGEESPVGLILCSESGREEMELLKLDRDGIVIAEYWTALPPKAEFEKKINTILTETRERLMQRNLLPLEEEKH